MPPGRLPGEVFRARPTGRRPRGRPRTRWRDYVGDPTPGEAADDGWATKHLCFFLFVHYIFTLFQIMKQCGKCVYVHNPIALFNHVPAEQINPETCPLVLDPTLLYSEISHQNKGKAKKKKKGI